MVWEVPGIYSRYLDIWDNVIRDMVYIISMYGYMLGVLGIVYVWLLYVPKLGGSLVSVLRFFIIFLC